VQTLASAASDIHGPDATHVNRAALRRSRFIMAALTSIVLCVLMVVLYFLDMMSGDTVLRSTALIVVSVLLFHLLFRSGLNLKSSDPSLTVPMTAAAVLCVLYTMLGSAIAREAFASFFALALLFGVFRFPTRLLLLEAGLIVLGYAAIIFLSWEDRPQDFLYRTDIARLITLATVLPLFALVGGQIMAGRRAAYRLGSLSGNDQGAPAVRQPGVPGNRQQRRGTLAQPCR